MAIVQPPAFHGPQQFQPQYEPSNAEQVFGGLGAGMGQVLQLIQQQKENEYRQQQLATNQQFAQAQRAQVAAQMAEQQARLVAQRQVGGAMRGAMGGQPQQPMQQPMPQPGQATQGQPGVFQQLLSGGAQALAPAQGNPDIFGGVADENMADAVEGVGNALALQPQEPKTPAEIQEFQFYSSLSPEQQAQYQQWKRLNQAPGTTVNVDTGKVETAYGVEGAKADVATRTDVLKAANAATRAFPSLHEGYRMLRKGTVVAGVGSSPILQMHRVLGSMKIKVSKEAVEDTQTASRLLYEGVAAKLEERTFGSGTAVSDQDRKAAERMAGVDFSLNIGALKKVARINVGLNIEKMIGATMLLDKHIEAYPEAAKRLMIEKRDLEAKLYGAKGSKDKPSSSSIWGRYLDMLGNEASEEAKDAAGGHSENPYR
jgi:hypothetical protein